MKKRIPNSVRSMKEVWKRLYPPLRDAFLDANPICFKCKETIPRHLRTLHHWAGRVHALLIYQPFFKMACRDCHNWIESHRSTASAMGWRSREDVFNRPSLLIPEYKTFGRDGAVGKQTGELTRSEQANGVPCPALSAGVAAKKSTKG